MRRVPMIFVENHAYDDASDAPAGPPESTVSRLRDVSMITEIEQLYGECRAATVCMCII